MRLALCKLLGLRHRHLVPPQEPGGSLEQQEPSQEYPSAIPAAATALVAPGRGTGGCSHSYPFISNMGLRPPAQAARCPNKHSHILLFTVPAHAPERPQKSNLVPGRAHFSPNSAHDRQAGPWFVQPRGRAGPGLAAGTRLTALPLLSVLRQRSQLRPGCHGTVRLVTHSSLWPKQKRDESSKEKQRPRGEQQFPAGRVSESLLTQCGSVQGSVRCLLPH